MVHPTLLATQSLCGICTLFLRFFWDATVGLNEPRSGRKRVAIRSVYNHVTCLLRCGLPLVCRTCNHSRIIPSAGPPSNSMELPQTEYHIFLRESQSHVCWKVEMQNALMHLAIGANMVTATVARPNYPTIG